MSENNKAFKAFVMGKCSDFVKTEENITEDQKDKIVLAYKKGFIDALNVLEAKNIIEMRLYI